MLMLCYKVFTEAVSNHMCYVDIRSVINNP